MVCDIGRAIGARAISRANYEEYKGRIEALMQDGSLSKSRASPQLNKDIFLSNFDIVTVQQTRQ